MSETTIVPGNPPEWREFANEDYDPGAAIDSDEDTLGELIAERTNESPFGIVIVADPVETISDDLVRRLAAAMIPARVRRASRSEHKVGEKKGKKGKKDKD